MTLRYGGWEIDLLDCGTIALPAEALGPDVDGPQPVLPLGASPARQTLVPEGAGVRVPWAWGRPRPRSQADAAVAKRRASRARPPPPQPPPRRGPFARPPTRSDSGTNTRPYQSHNATAGMPISVILPVCVLTANSKGPPSRFGTFSNVMPKTRSVL